MLSGPKHKKEKIENRAYPNLLDIGSLASSFLEEKISS
jgi:hypothetical protein